MLVQVRDNNVDQALKALKKKMQREGIFREMKLRNYYEKPSEKRVREQAEAVRRARKLARKRAQREGLLPGKAAVKPGARPGGRPGSGPPARRRRRSSAQRWLWRRWWFRRSVVASAARGNPAARQFAVSGLAPSSGAGRFGLSGAGRASFSSPIQSLTASSAGLPLM